MTADGASAAAAGAGSIFEAAATAEPDILRALLVVGADPNEPYGEYHERPLVSALRAARNDNFQVLLEAGADPNATDDARATPLHRAALVDNAPRVLDLLQAGAEPTSLDEGGHTFQDYLWQAPDAFYKAEAKAARLAIRRWLKAHGVAITEVPAP
jgi:uncharacterized protein